MEPEPLSKKSHFELALLAQQGNDAARDLLLEKHEPILRHVAEQYTDHPLPYDDRHAIALGAFFEAVKAFNPKKIIENKTTFRSFLRKLARNKILEADPRLQTRRILGQTWQRLSQLHEELERIPTLEELAQHLGITPQGVRTRLLTDPTTGKIRSRTPPKATAKTTGLKGAELTQAKTVLKNRLVNRQRKGDAETIQYQVAVLRARGMRPRQIAIMLGLEDKSIDNAFKRIRETLDRPPRKRPKDLVTDELAKTAQESWWLTEEEKRHIQRLFIDNEKPQANDNRLMRKLADTINEHAARVPPQPKPRTYRME